MEVYRSGKIKAIGVANWSISYLEKLRKTWTVVPAVNQVEPHTFFPQHELRYYHVNKGVVVLPKSVTEKRISSNKEVISLSTEELAVLDGIAAQGKAKRLNTPLWGFDLGFEDRYGPVGVN
ncbi:uncharacterized protein ATNIH1004_011602 [Aspergillus tanneri]|uniref:D-xylose reductase [NAD(P)H] n=1 Tax=Aspergillus tanneri TaxID=1220188 RepID=A0A5M9MIG5_9EURO|nr:uncharacterized protein ATNIH1004_011602 [Aspergillus tanneri]KAA8642657.1 hypothetical protein ATNIH1004_011602 [Aspergillus tanneri]